MPKPAQMGRILFEVARGSIRTYLPNVFPQKLSKLFASKVERLTLLGLVKPNGHIVRLKKATSM